MSLGDALVVEKSKRTAAQTEGSKPSDGMSDKIAAMELGGTKTVVALGDDQGRLLEEFRYPTTTPEETMAVAVAWWRERASFDRLGIGSFGPIRVDVTARDYGTFLTTPKLAWQGFSLSAFVREHLPGVRLFLDTDVQAALLAEMTCGAARGVKDALYLTVGTGIGAGIASGGRLVHGALHPEMGHLLVRRHPEDSFAGVCPYHGDCWEGLASGPAMAQRWGAAAHTLPSDHPAWEMEAFYLAQGLYAACAMVSPQRLILGGGVSQAEGLLEKVSVWMDRFSQGYFESLGARVVAPVLGQQAGIVGAIQLALCGDKEMLLS
jgi:fructokinase